MFKDLLVHIKARVRAVTQNDWLGAAGERFRKTGSAIAEFSQERIRPEERLNEAPDLVWNRVQGEANEKHSQALVNYAEEEGKRIANETARRTADDKAREAKASADKLQAEARTAYTNELLARIALIERCRNLGLLPIWNKAGAMTIVPAPVGFDWDGLCTRLLAADDVQDVGLLLEGRQGEDTTRPA